MIQGIADMVKVKPDPLRIPEGVDPSTNWVLTLTDQAGVEHACSCTHELAADMLAQDVEWHIRERVPVSPSGDLELRA